ncbi:uncharacterized protein [Malus domestica]
MDLEVSTSSVKWFKPFQPKGSSDLGGEESALQIALNQSQRQTQCMESCARHSAIYYKIMLNFPSLETAQARSKSGIQAIPSLHVVQRQKHVNKKVYVDLRVGDVIRFGLRQRISTKVNITKAITSFLSETRSFYPAPTLNSLHFTWLVAVLAHHKLIALQLLCLLGNYVPFYALCCPNCVMLPR